MRLVTEVSVLFAMVIVPTLIVCYFLLPMFGKLPGKYKSSAQYKDGIFRNLNREQVLPQNISRIVWKFLNNKTVVPVIPSIKTDLFSLKEDVLVWFGHSSYFIQIEDIKILVDPVFSEVSSPIPFFPKAFNGTNIYDADDIPEIDYLIITHDHWDHLDYNTMKKLKDKIRHVFCPLGVNSHLIYWGVDEQKITEMDWGDLVKTEDEFRIFCFPSQHFSGRNFVRNKTLWASFLTETPTLFRIFFGCDGGYDKHFVDIGRQFPDIDLAILENGQYNENWKYIHMHPNEVVQAAKDLNAKSLFPIHVAKFALSMHPWNEPLDRICELGKSENFEILTPMIGEKVELRNPNQTFSKWWLSVTKL
jgi:L-ascorbate metabolism protein UlaG (beta-lactamase superfamily)